MDSKQKRRVLSRLDNAHYFCAKARVLRGFLGWMVADLQLTEKKASALTDALLMKNFQQEPFLSILGDLKDALLKEGHRVSVARLVDESMIFFKQEKQMFFECNAPHAV